MKQSPVSAWTIIAFLMGTLFGSGGVWEYQRIKLDSQKLEIERAVQTTDLREKENEELAKIVELSNEYVSVASQYEKAPNAELRSQLTIR
jgi:hypothetical protein